MKNIKLSANKGFTLVEILVVFALVSILMLTSVATFSSFTKSQSFQTMKARIQIGSLSEVRIEETIP